MSMSGGGYDDLCLPPEICSEILTRVPIKSILRFRSVSKSWNSLISCPHFKPKTIAHRILLNRLEGKAQAWSLSAHDESFSEPRDIGEDLPDRFRGQRLDPIGSCDGLICLYNYGFDRSTEEITSSFLIYNPAIRKIVELPSLTFGLYTQIPHYYGFGFDSKAGDYKVMLVFTVYGDDKSYVGFMFDLSNGVWRNFTPILPNYWRPAMRCPEFYLNDAVHWHGGCCYEHASIYISSFNMSDETFRVMSMPAELGRDLYLIMTSGGLIYALATYRAEVEVEVWDPHFSVWVMKEYGVTESWTKVFAVDMPPQFCRSMVTAQVYPLIFRGPEVAEVLLKYSPLEEEEYLAGVESVQHLISYNNESGESKYLLLLTDKDIVNMVFYKESLVLM